MEEKNNKSNNKLYSIIIVLCLMVIGLSTYILYDKVDTNENTVNNGEVLEPEKKVEELSKDVVISKAEYMLDNVVGSYFDNYGIYSFLKGYKGSINDIPNQTKLQMIYWTLKNGIDNKSFEELTSDEILAYFRKIFGSDYTITFEDIKVLGDDNYLAWTYNKKTKCFEDAMTGRGVDYMFLSIIKSKFVKYNEIESGKYTLTFKQLFNYFQNDDKGSYVFVNFDGKKLFTKDGSLYEGSIENTENNISKLIKEELPKYEDKLIEVDYTFEVENGELVLKGINY